MYVYFVKFVSIVEFFGFCFDNEGCDIFVCFIWFGFCVDDNDICVWVVGNLYFVFVENVVVVDFFCCCVYVDDVVVSVGFRYGESIN